MDYNYNDYGVFECMADMRKAAPVKNAVVSIENPSNTGYVFRWVFFAYGRKNTLSRYFEKKDMIASRMGTVGFMKNIILGSHQKMKLDYENAKTDFERNG